MPSGFRHQLMLKYARCNLSCAIHQKLFSGQVSCTPIYADRDSLKAQEAFKAFNLSPLEVSEDVCDTDSSEIVLKSELLGVGFHRPIENRTAFQRPHRDRRDRSLPAGRFLLGESS